MDTVDGKITQIYMQNSRFIHALVYESKIFQIPDIIDTYYLCYTMLNTIFTHNYVSRHQHTPIYNPLRTLFLIVTIVEIYGNIYKHMYGNQHIIGFSTEFLANDYKYSNDTLTITTSNSKRRIRCYIGFVAFHNKFCPYYM